MQNQLDHSIISAASKWHVDVRRIRKEIDICGSPERCEFRFVIESRHGDLYVIESLLENEVSHKRSIISSLNHLLSRELDGINPYLPSSDGSYISKSNDRFWQISRFVEGIPLNRPDYIFDQWRGNVLADFLIDLRKTALNMPGFDRKKPFSITGYINTLADQISTYEPALYSEIEPVADYLRNTFFKTHDRLPVSFCHGDYHALNIIWGESGINAVIDWEFSGIKPEIYDVANMVGCIGVENPEALAGPLTTDFIRQLQKAGGFADISWQVLVEFVIALRFAWLSEWLRHRDREMIDLETVYIKLLVNNAKDLKHIWRT